MVQGICETIIDYPEQGAMPLFFSIRDCVPMAFEGLLLIIFLILFGCNYFIIKTKLGRSKILIALLASSFFMIPLSMFLALSQLVYYSTVVFYAFFCIIIFILFLLSDRT